MRPVREGTLDAPEAARRAFAGRQGWITNLLAVRNMLVSPFGLKTGADAMMSDSPRVGIFPVFQFLQSAWFWVLTIRISTSGLSWM